MDIFSIVFWIVVIIGGLFFLEIPQKIYYAIKKPKVEEVKKNDD